MSKNMTPIIIQPTNRMMKDIALIIPMFDFLWCKIVDKEKLLEKKLEGHYYIIAHKSLGMVVRLINKVFVDFILVSTTEIPFINYEIDSLLEIEKIIRCAN